MLDQEKELFDSIRTLIDNTNQVILKNYYNIGNKILNFYKKDYGDNVLGTIATYVGRSPQTLRKMIQLARQFKENDIDELCSGVFSVSYGTIVNNLK
ncbi:MAG: hypothetical protein HQK77_15765 [Desulfobacterales bacterium]|nr:hypothetical protein [Desulfobacterales bacterium]